MIDDARVVAVIIGRAGSRGLPGKNAIVLAGLPMIAHTIEHARESGCVDRVIVSTDSEAIAEAARNADVEVIDRPAALASDTATVDSAVRHAVEASGDAADIIVILYANVPVRPPGLIDRAIGKLIDTGADSVQSYCEVGKHHPWWMMQIDERSRVSQYFANTAYRRQDLPRLYLPDGGVIVVRRDALFTIDPEQPHAFLGRDRAAMITQPGEVIDIDTAADLVVAEAALGMQAMPTKIELT